MVRIYFRIIIGQRTPVYPEYSQQIYPYLWQDCHKTPLLHAFYQSLERFSAVNPGMSYRLRIESETPPSLYISFDGKDVKGLESFKHVETAVKLSKSFPGYCFYGQLTDTGKRNMMALGSRLRFHYIDQMKLLSQTLDPHSLYIRSTDYSRTIESVQYLLGGLYPKKNRNQGQDLKIHVRDYKDETMIPHTNCASLMSDTLKRKNELHEIVKQEAKIAFEQVKHLGIQDL